MEMDLQQYDITSLMLQSQPNEETLKSIDLILHSMYLETIKGNSTNIIPEDDWIVEYLLFGNVDERLLAPRDIVALSIHGQFIDVVNFLFKHVLMTIFIIVDIGLGYHYIKVAIAVPRVNTGMDGRMQQYCDGKIFTQEYKECFREEIVAFDTVRVRRVS